MVKIVSTKGLDQHLSDNEMSGWADGVQWSPGEDEHSKPKKRKEGQGVVTAFTPKAVSGGCELKLRSR